jgi:hypothetical protein
VVAYDLYTPEWEGLVAKSKFAAEEFYARAPSGSIGLQDHGTPVAYKNMKIRPLGGTVQEAVDLDGVEDRQNVGVMELAGVVVSFPRAGTLLTDRGVLKKGTAPSARRLPG